ncbi:MAG: NlpC/P60 protein [Patescibacteria group bacterium]|nr:NlpC/P60 protein [Patescibacteria group bacterium]
MNSFIKSLFTVLIFLAGFFVFFGVSSVEACEIVSGQTSIRPQGWFTINQYEDDPRPFVYLDVKTIDCNTTSGNIFRVLLQNVQFSTILSSGIEVVPIQEIKIAFTDTASSPNGSADFQSTTSDLSIPLMVGERGDLEGCEAVAGIEDCIIAIKIFNDSITGSPEIFNLSQNGSGLMYECDYSCQTYWQLGCPVGDGQAPNPLPYGGICSTDNTTIDITTTGVLNTGGVVSGEYSTTPLAPLPGFTGDPDVGQWLESLFTILIVIAGLLALIMIVVGGITYLTSESFGEKGKGKSYIVNAITGLVLALGAWVILNTINPELAEDLNIKIPTVELSIGDADSWSSNSQTNSSGTITGYEPLPNIGLQCPMGGGSSSVASIIDSFQGKTTYRWGGKGASLPPGGQFRLSPGEQSNGPYMCEGPTGQVPCRSFCPDSSVCLDCSGFVNQVRRCSGLPTFSGTSSMTSSPNAVPVEMNNLSSDGQSITIQGTPYTFVPGDILVWDGHVVIYYGNGQIAESAGAVTTNTNIKKSALSSYSGKNRITHLIKVNP